MRPERQLREQRPDPDHRRRPGWRRPGWNGQGLHPLQLRGCRHLRAHLRHRRGSGPGREGALHGRDGRQCRRHDHRVLPRRRRLAGEELLRHGRGRAGRQQGLRRRNCRRDKGRHEGHRQFLHCRALHLLRHLRQRGRGQHRLRGRHRSRLLRHQRDHPLPLRRQRHQQAVQRGDRHPHHPDEQERLRHLRAHQGRNAHGDGLLLPPQRQPRDLHEGPGRHRFYIGVRPTGRRNLCRPQLLGWARLRLLRNGFPFLQLQ